MVTVLRYSYLRFRGSILGWGLSLAVLGGYLAQFYDTLASPDMRSQLEALISGYPPELMAFFGEFQDMFSPSGFLNIEFFSYMTIILGIFILLAGSDLLSGDEESGKLDLLLSYPVSRRTFFFGRLFAFILAFLSILVIAWLAFVISIPSTTMDISPVQMAFPFLSLFGVLLLFAALALLLSQLLPSRRMAAMVTGLLLVASFFITSLARIDERLEQISQFSPLNYYQGGLALEGMNWTWMLVMLGFSLMFILLAWWRFERRDIRVGGEAGWSLSTWRRKQTRV